MLGSLLLSSPADAEPEGPRELLAPATPVLLAGRVGYSETIGADQKNVGDGVVKEQEIKCENMVRERDRERKRQEESIKAQ